jgi:hypothetical protein
MNYAVETGSDATKYIISFRRTGLAIPNLIEYTGIQTKWRSHKPTSVFQNKKSRQKNIYI